MRQAVWRRILRLPWWLPDPPKTLAQSVGPSLCYRGVLRIAPRALFVFNAGRRVDQLWPLTGLERCTWAGSEPFVSAEFSAVIKVPPVLVPLRPQAPGATGAGAGVAATLGCTTSGIFTFGADATFRLVRFVCFAFVADLGTGKADVGGDFIGLITGDGMGVSAGAVWVTDR
ncbi:MAG: hypothetical protein IPH54_20710 [Rhodoferax sp.]|nr:hypothetical protein [Rhodoferax sp.]